MAKREAFRTSLLCSLVFHFAMAANKSKYVLKGLFGKWKRLTLIIFHLILHPGRRRLGHRYIHQTRHMHAFDWSVLLKTKRINEIMMTREFHRLSQYSMPSSCNVSHHSDGICDLTSMIDSMSHALGCTNPISEEMLNGNEWIGKINFNKRNAIAKLWQLLRNFVIFYHSLRENDPTQTFAIFRSRDIYIPPFEHRAVVLILFGYVYGVLFLIFERIKLNRFFIPPSAKMCLVYDIWFVHFSALWPNCAKLLLPTMANDWNRTQNGGANEISHWWN